MGSTPLEELLQELVTQNATIIDKLDDIVAVITEIKDELNWIGEHSFAKRVVDLALERPPPATTWF